MNAPSLEEERWQRNAGRGMLAEERWQGNAEMKVPRMAAERVLA